MLFIPLFRQKVAPVSFGKIPLKCRKLLKCLKLTAQDLFSFGVIEQIISEQEGQESIYATIDKQLHQTIAANAALPVEELLENRYQKFRKIGGALT